MAGRPPAYPFAPKSNRWLEPGQFWSVPLADGRYACGRVMARPGDSDERAGFVAGLMEWAGDAPPHSAEIAGCGVLSQGVADIRVIHETGGFILGCRALELDDLVAESPTCAWGYEDIVRLAERRLS